MKGFQILSCHGQATLLPHGPAEPWCYCRVLRRPFSDEASSLPDMSTVVIPESTAVFDGVAVGRQEPGVSVPSLALDKVPSLHGKASGNTAATSQTMSQTSKPDSEAEAAPAMGEASPRSDQLTSEQVAALEGEAPVLLRLHDAALTGANTQSCCTALKRARMTPGQTSMTGTIIMA